MDLEALPHHTPVPFRLAVSAAEPEESARRAAAAVGPGGVVYYALGSGLGHLTRGLAIGRKFACLRPEPFSILTSCPVPVAEPGCLIQLEGQLPDGPALARLVRALVRELRPAVLAVDAFPAGILGELPDLLPSLDCRRVAVLRLLQPRWIDRWNLRALLETAYDRPLLVERSGSPPHPHTPTPPQLPPVLIRDGPELLDPSSARARLGHRGDGPLVCVVVTGASPAEQGLLGAARRAVERVTDGAAVVRLATPYPGGLPQGDYVFHFPLIEWLPGADLVIGPCGYHLCHETAALGIPAIFVPQPRLYDDQITRAAGRPVARSPEELEGLISAMLAPSALRRQPARYANGADEVAGCLAALI